MTLYFHGIGGRKLGRRHARMKHAGYIDNAKLESGSAIGTSIVIVYDATQAWASLILEQGRQRWWKLEPGIIPKTAKSAQSQIQIYPSEPSRESQHKVEMNVPAP